MSSTLAALYTRYSARLAAHIAEELVTAGGDPLADTDDATQDVWLRAAELNILPAVDGAWTLLTTLADQVVARTRQTPHLEREILSGMQMPAVRVLPPPPMPRLAPAPADAEQMVVAA